MDEKETSTIQLDDQQFDRVMHILKEERHVYEVTLFQKIAFVLLTIWIVAFLLIVAYFLIFKSEPKIYGFFIGDTLAYISPLLLLLNLPLIYRILKNKWMMYRLRFTKTFIKEWKVRRHKKRFFGISIVTIITSILGSFLIFLAIYAVVFLKERELNFVLLVIGIGFTFIAFGLLVIGYERLKFFAELTKLKESFLKLREEQIQTPTPGTEVPITDLDLVTKIEQSQIDRDRAKVIESFMKSAPSELPEYALLKGRDLIKKIAGLDLDLRLQVEEQIERLSFEPHPEESLKDPSGDYWHLRVPETSLELKYTVDDSQRQVQIIALENVTERTMSASLPGGPPHE
jgi:mRNA-degrading endonuclease RelE of RelBE toxin-antitoxin system